MIMLFLGAVRIRYANFVSELIEGYDDRLGSKKQQVVCCLRE